MKMGRKHYKDAQQRLQRATQIDPKLFEAWHNLGVLLAALGEYDKAIDNFRKALESDPNDADMRARYGQMLREAGQLEESLEQARILLGQGGQGEAAIGKTVIAYNALGLTYYK